MKVKKINYIGPFIVLSLLTFYFVSPELYLKYILHPVNRELQLVEIMTFIPALLSAIVLFYISSQSIKNKKPIQLSIAILTVGLAVFFFAGEEISWGQSYFGWETPLSYQDKAVETNLHNTDLPIHGLANIFLISLFFIFPLLMKKKKNIPDYYNILKPENSVIYFVLTGYIWKSLKSLFITLVSDYKSIPFYCNFMEQMNEHKEMIVALSFLMLSFQTFKKFKKSEQF